MLGKNNNLNNNRPRAVLFLDEVNYLIEVLDSNISDKEKAYKLYDFCPDRNFLIKTYEIHKEFDSKKADSILKLIEKYDEYNKLGYFSVAKKSYKCTYQEMIYRLDVLNLIFDTINSNLSDIDKAKKLYLYYNSAEKFRKSYSLFIKFGENDKRLDIARTALDNFDKIYKIYLDYEMNHLFAQVKQQLEYEKDYEQIKKARPIIQDYIISSDSYRKSKFYKTHKITKEEFDKYVAIVKKYDDNLYNQYLEKNEKNRTLRFMKNYLTLEELGQAIKTGKFSNGTQLTLLEFIKKTPFKYSENYLSTITSFMQTSGCHYYKIIMNYIYNNRLNGSAALNKINLKQIYETKVILNGKEIKKEDVDQILDYMDHYDIPRVNRAYTIMKTMYSKDELDFSYQNKQKQKELSEN